MTFAEMKILCEGRGITTVEGIMQETKCGTGCGLCRPYIDQMLRTGEVEIEWNPDYAALDF